MQVFSVILRNRFSVSLKKQRVKFKSVNETGGVLLFLKLFEVKN